MRFVPIHRQSPASGTSGADGVADVSPDTGNGGGSAGAGEPVPSPQERATHERTPHERTPRERTPMEGALTSAISAPVVVPRWIQLVVLPLALLGLWALARASGSILLVLVIAGVIATILNPLVKKLERVLPRGLAIVAVYLGAFAALTGVGILLSDPISTQVNHFADEVPHLVREANRDLDNLQSWLNRNGIRVQIKQQGQTALQTLQNRVEKSSGSIVSFTRGLLGEIVTISIDLILTLVLSIYLLTYARQIGGLVRRIMPAGDGTAEDDYPLLIQRAVSGYLRGQLTFSTIMGASAAICLWILGVAGVFPAGEQYALFFGAFYGLMEFIPYVGPIIGPIPAVLVALFANPVSAVWVTILFVGLQQLEGHFVAPQVFRISLQINPILVILSLLIGYKLYGIAGALVAMPLAAMARQTVVYLRRHLVLEPWSVAMPDGGVLQLAGSQCRRCGAGTDPHDAYCRTCGALSSREVGEVGEVGEAEVGEVGEAEVVEVREAGSVSVSDSG
ncbi:MAG: AI-2E family transporter [Solirubrobacteraceae bacterium]